MSQKTYKSPPLIEAIFEIRFSEPIEYTDALVKVFAERIHNVAPDQTKARRNQVDVQLEEGKDKVSRQIFEFEQFLSEDKRYLIQLDLSRISIHRLAPYESWGNFLPFIESILLAHTESFGVIDIARVGLRYINRIVAIGSFSESFTMQFNLPADLDRNVLVSSSAVLVRANDAGDRYRINIGPSDPKPEAYILDIDYFNEEVLLSRENLGAWLNTAHSSIETLFEELVVPAVKETFDT